jgi:ferredoxin--NADP+ reductase
LQADPPAPAAADGRHKPLPISVAIIGAGPAGFYTAEALLNRHADVRIDIIERLATPFGLIRAGVAPDHQSTKLVSRRFEETALQDVVHFYGNVEVGDAVTLDELRRCYDAVVLAVGAAVDRPLGIPGEHLQGVYGAALFVGWYNGHPDFRYLRPNLAASAAVVIGNGNVALDVARVLVKTEAEMAASDLADHAADAIRGGGIRDVYIVGRRGAADAKFTSAELRELGELEDCEVLLSAADLTMPPEITDKREQRLREKNLTILRGIAGPCGTKRKRLHFRFNLAPVAIEGNQAAERVIFEHTRTESGRAIGTGAFEPMPSGLVISAIGYRTSALDGVPFNTGRGLYPSDDGRIEPGLYVVGWAKRGPVGVIGSNRPDGALCADQIITDTRAAEPRKLKSGRAGLERCLASRGVRSITFDDWLKIDAAEVTGARKPAPRRKFTTLGEMLSVLADAGLLGVEAVNHDISR